MEVEERKIRSGAVGDDEGKVAGIWRITVSNHDDTSFDNQLPVIVFCMEAFRGDV